MRPAKTDLQGCSCAVGLQHQPLYGGVESSLAAIPMSSLFLPLFYFLSGMVVSRFVTPSISCLIVFPRKSHVHFCRCVFWRIRLGLLMGLSG
jgi:hypothetical protein